MNAPTHVAVPTELWLRTMNLIGEELSIKKGIEVWQALQQCKPLTPAPPAEPAVPSPPANGAKEPAKVTA